MVHRRVNELAETANSIKSRIRTVRAATLLPLAGQTPYSNFLHQMYTGIAELMKLATINEEDGR